MPAQPRRVAVFIDYQNCYGAAREAFASGLDPSYVGNFSPMALGKLLASKGSGSYKLVFVGVYCGIAEPRMDPRTHSARSKQIARWKREGATVFARSLRYPPGWKVGITNRDSPREKGVDVKMAIDAVMGALRDEYDVAILATCDNDFVPVVEALLELGATNGKPEVEVIAWKDRNNRLGISGRQLVERWIGPNDFRAMVDSTDYNVG